MPSIDERVVAMSFENSVFEARVATTMATLSKLDHAIKNIGSTNGLQNIEAAANKVTLQGPMSALDKLKAKLGGAGAGAAQGLSEIDRAGNKVTLEGPGRAVDKLQGKMAQLSAGSTFTDIEKAADRVELSGLTRALDNVSNKFGVLEGAASVAFGNIASQAAMKGATFAKSFAFGPIQDGFKEYSTNLNSIQTILANTEGQQVSGLGEVNKHLDELNHYSDQTIYNFSEMAKNIGTFTAAGVDMDKSTQSIKGIANLAALSGSNSQQASTAMYQLSQAIASGKVGLQDWNSVVNAGMGGAVFQKSLMRTAENMGALKNGAVEIDKATGKATINGQSFRESIMAKPGQKSWLTSDVLVKTLGQFTGDMKEADLIAQGFSKTQAQSIMQQAKTAKAAATEVKTLSQVFDVAKETIGSGWSTTFKNIFGDFEESKKTFTGLSNFINGFVNRSSDARNKVLGDWKKLGGRDELIAGFKAGFAALSAVLKPVSEAFRDIFPRKTGDDLEALTAKFKSFMEALKPSETTIDNIRRTFAGLFAVVHIGWSIIKGLASVIFDLLGVVGKGSGGFLSFTGGIGDFLVAIDTALTKGGLLKGFFNGLSAIIQLPLQLLKAIGHAIANLFGGGNADATKGFEDSITNVGNKLGPLKKVIDVIVSGWNAMTDALGKVKAALDPWFSQMADKLKGIGDVLANVFSDLDFNKIMAGLQTGFIGGIFLTLKKALGGGLPSVFGDSLKGVNGLLKGVTGNLEAMQKNIQADTLLKIGAAIAVLAGAIFVLSTIKAENLSKAMTAVAVGLGELMGAMKLMTSGMGKLGILQLPIIAASMIGLATAVLILSGAVKVFSTMNWEEIGKGLAGVAGSIVSIALGMKLMPPTLPLTAVGLILIGVALNVIAVAMQQFGAMKMTEIAKGVFAMVEALGGIALGVSMMPPTLPLTAAGLILMGIALAAIGGAIKSMGSMDFGTIVKGLAAMIVAIAGIGLAISLVPPTIALTAAGLLILGQAMIVTAGAIALLGSMGVGTLVKGIAGLAAALIVLAGGLTLMIVSLPGSVALLVAAGALAVLVPVMGLLGTMRWSTIFKGLGAIALVLVTIGVAGLIAAPALAALGIALIPLGVGFLLVASAAKLFASAVALLSSEGQKGFGVLLAAITGFVALLPNIIISFVKGLVSIADQIAVLAPKIIMALGVIIDTIIAFVITEAPKLAIAIGVLVDSILQVLLTNSPKLIAAGVTLLMNLLNGISQNIGQVTTKVAEIIVKFLSALNSNLPKLIDAGAKTLQSFLTGITSKFGAMSATVGTMIGQFASAVAGNAARMVTIAGDMMLKFIGGIASYIPKVVGKAGEIILSVVSGLGRNINQVVTKGADVIIAFIQGIGSNMKRIANKGADAVISFLNGMAETIRNKGPELRQAGWNVADALLDGIWNGIEELGHKVVDKLGALVRLLPDKVKKLLGIKSPSTVFMEIGRFTMLGLSKGIDDNSRQVTGSAETVGNSVIGAIRNVFGIHSPSEVFREIGMNVNRGFRDGLLGSKADVLSAFDTMNSSLIDKIRELRTQVADGNSKLEDLHQQHAEKLVAIADLKSKKKPDKEAIATAVKESQDLEAQIIQETAAVNQNGKALTAARDIRASLTGSMKDEKNQLIGLKNEYEAVNKKIEESTATLEKITQEQKKYTDQFNVKPDVDNLVSNALADAALTDQERRDKQRKAEEEADKRSRINQVELYKKALQEQIVATAKYQETLQKLRDLGLDEATFTKLLDKGLSGQEFADQLLASGKTGIDKINQLDNELLAKSTALADAAIKELYDTGVAVAQGVVDGLKAKKAELEKQMSDLADVMVNAIKSKLKIKSPSRIFMEVGKFAAEGLAQGLTSSSKAVFDAAGKLGTDAVSAMQNTIAAISSAVSENINVDPTITPVLDLSQVQKDAQKLSDLTNVTPITAAASYGQASAASQEVSATQQAVAGAAAAAGTPSFSFEQNNYSPEALSDVEIYRQTKNQLGQVKKALGLVS